MDRGLANAAWSRPFQPGTERKGPGLGGPRKADIARPAHPELIALTAAAPDASTAAAIRYLTRAISTRRASRVRWWYQREQAW